MAVLYHGTSSLFAQDIIKNGLGIVQSDNKYDEIRYILSKYINPQILTDEFFDKYAQYISSGSYSSINIRESQREAGNGPFGVFYSNYSETPYHAAASYAKSTTSFGAGEFEYGIIKFLNTISEKLENTKSNPNFTPPEYQKFLELLINNTRPQYITPEGKLNFYTDGNYEKDFPILLRIEIPDDQVYRKWDDDARIKETVKPENITGIAFLPSFNYNELYPFDRYTPQLKFFSKELFLEELSKRQGKRHWCEPFEVLDTRSQKTSILFTFPTNDIACAQNYFNGNIDKAVFYARKEHLNKGKIAEKNYKNGLPYQCEFFENGELTARVLYKDRKPNKFVSFNGKKLNPKQLFILKYEKQAQNISTESLTAHIEQRKKEIRERLSKTKDITSIPITTNDTEQRKSFSVSPLQIAIKSPKNSYTQE